MAKRIQRVSTLRISSLVIRRRTSKTTWRRRPTAYGSACSPMTHSTHLDRQKTHTGTRMALIANNIGFLSVNLRAQAAPLEAPVCSDWHPLYP